MKQQIPYGNRLRELREESGLTQADLADIIGMTRQTIIAIERGKYSPTLDSAFRIADALDVEIGEIFYRK